MSTPAPPVTALQDVASAKAWLARQPQANATQLQAALATEIARLNQGAATPAARLSILEFLREAVSFAQGECVKKFSGRALPLAPHEQFAYEASRTLWQLLGERAQGLYHLDSNSAEAWRFDELVLALKAHFVRDWQVEVTESYRHDQRLLGDEERMPPLSQRLVRP